MRILIELEGVIFDVATAYHAAHREAATALGWSSLDQPTHWRILRKEGPTGNFLPGAKPLKLTQYQTRFAQVVERDEVIDRITPQGDIAVALEELFRFGSCTGVTLGSNIAAREQAMARIGLSRLLTGAHALDPDPRRRPTQLKSLAGGDAGAMVVGSTDVLLRSASAAELFLVGVSSGPCIAARLHQAGATIVYPTLGNLFESLRSGATDLIRAGLRPLALPTAG